MSGCNPLPATKLPPMVSPGRTAGTDANETNGEAAGARASCGIELNPKSLGSLIGIHDPGCGSALRYHQ